MRAIRNATYYAVACRCSALCQPVAFDGLIRFIRMECVRPSITDLLLVDPGPCTVQYCTVLYCTVRTGM